MTSRTLAWQSGEGKGLLEQGDTRVERAVVANRIFGVARHVEDLHLGTQRAELVGEFTPVHAGHDDVGQEQMDGPGIRREI